MSSRFNPARAAAVALALAPLGAGPAFAHAVCGARTFPATIGIDDPGVGDEVSLPTISYLPSNPDGFNEAGIGFSYTKTILPNFGLSVESGAGFVNGQGWGRQNLELGAAYNFLCLPQIEFMATAGLSVELGRTYTNGMGEDVTAYSPTLTAGIGFGALPNSLGFLRPLALTAQFSQGIPSQLWTNDEQNPGVFNWGFAVQYSLPYMNASVQAIDNDFLRRLIPIAEFTFSRPNYNFAGPAVTTGAFQPGVIYAGGPWQLAVEAVLPINSASGKGVGVVGQLHFYLDDLMPDTLGRPIFGGRK